ncbi:translocation/assembly module TamB domain-containing protein [Desulforhopalus sp. 52FAK]
MKKYLFVLLIVAVFLLPIGVLLGTEWGLQRAVTAASSLSSGAVTVDSVKGRIATGYDLGGITIATAGADIDIENFHWSWKPLALLKGTLDVVACKTEQVSVNFKSTTEEPKEDGDSAGLPNFVPPIQLILREFSFRDVKLFDSDGTLLFQIDTFNTSLTLGAGGLVVNSFGLDGPEIGLRFHGNIALDGDHKLDLMGNWRVVGYGFHPSKGTFSAKGPINSLGVNVALNDPGKIQVVGVIENLLDNPTWTADLDAQNINLETWILHCPEIILETVHGDMSGDFGHYRGLVVADGYWGVADNLHLQSNIDGSIWGIVFDSLRIDRNETSAVATNASISWEQLFSWEADLDFQNFVFSMFFPEFDGSVSSSFHTVGDVTEEGLDASFALNTMTGQFTDYVWSAAGNIGLTDEKIFSSDLVLKSDSVGGEAVVRYVELSWFDKLSWGSDIDFHDFDPGFIHKEMAGRINGRVKSFLEWQEDDPAGSLEILGLSGDVRGSELYGGGTIAIDGHVLSSDGLELLLGDSRLSVLGTVNDNFGLEFTFESSDLSNIAAHLAGSLSLDGLVTGSKKEPKIDFRFSGSNIQTGNERIGDIDGHLGASLETDGFVDGAIIVKKSLINGYGIDKLEATASGTLLNHELHTEVETTEGNLRLDIIGKYQEGWSGTFAGLSLVTDKYGNWNQVDSAALELSSQNQLLKDFCLSTTISNTSAGDNGKACLTAARHGGEEGNWSLITELNSFELKSLTDMDFGLPPITGIVEAKIQAEGNRAGVNSAQVSVTIPELDTLLHVTDADFVSVQLRDSIITADLVDQNLDLNVFFRSNNGGTLGLKGAITNIGFFDTPLRENIISGELNLNKYYLASLAAFTGYGIEPTGWVSSSIKLSGSLAQPEIYGKLAIRDGGLELPYQGINLQNVVVSVDSREFGAFVHAEATSGGGKLNADGYVSHGDDGIETSLRLTGDNFLLVNLPEYSFRVTPEAVLKINKNRGQIDGRVVVPSGLIAPEELSGAVKVSDDVIYLGEEKNHEKKGYPFYLDLDVLLGDDVNVEGYGLEGRLGGKLNVKVTPTDFITGRGELDLIESTFTFYGRTLDIERGRMLFTGGPIDNPGVDIRAQKIVTAATAIDDGYTVGVDINGLVQDLQFHLFSDPYKDDTEILSQMVVGHSFASSNEEEGTMLQAAAMTLGFGDSSKVMKGMRNLLLIDDLHLEGSAREEDVSLVVGKRITDDLYIGYDMNMFSQLGQFRVRYDLSRGFFVETRSSSESTGADLIYTFER